MPGSPRLYSNNCDGTFSNITDRAGLKKTAYAMGANFGDADNDGFLDIYLGTGNPNYSSLVPNKFFKNLQGKKFGDATNSSRLGNLQKGHGVSFADLDNDGEQDIHVDLGGAYRGDAYPNAFYLNQAQSANNWICLKLEGVRSNRAAIGARVTVRFKELGKSRMVVRELNSGGSFGCSPLRCEIGLGRAEQIDEIEIFWPAGNARQKFVNVPVNQFLRIREGESQLETRTLKKLVFKKADGSIPMCAPVN